MSKKPLIASLVPAVMLVAVSAFGRTVRVTSTAELGAAIAAAQPGDDIVLASGTYASTGITCIADATPQSPITVRSEVPLGADVRFDALEGFHVYGKSWHFRDLSIKGVCAVDSDCEHAFHVVGGADGFELRTSRVVDFNAQLKVNADTVNGAQVAPRGGLVEGNEVFDTRPRNTQNPVTKLNMNEGDAWIVRANYIHDVQKTNTDPTYGAFMKGGGKGGLFERNLVICAHDHPSTGPNVGLSFGGGGTGAQFCAPAYDPNVPCDIEHTGGIMRNNVIVNCSDVGIYVNRGKDTKLLYNTLIANLGIDFRFPTASGEARGNVSSSAIRARDTATFMGADNLLNVAASSFAAWYRAPMDGDLRIAGDVSALIGKGPVLADVPDDYCARTRSVSAYTLGALEHALGDCVTQTPPPGDGGVALPPDAGASADAGTGPPPPSSQGDAGGSAPGASTSSGCAAICDNGANRGGGVALLLAIALAAARRRARR